jgi:hypothetical protein
MKQRIYVEVRPHMCADSSMKMLTLIGGLCRGGFINFIARSNFLGDINTGTWPSRLGEFQMRQ